MKVTVQLPEEVVERLGGVDAAGKGLLARLKVLPDYAPTDRLIVLSNAERVALEQTFGQPLETGGDVVRVASRLAYIDVGGIHRPLTTSEAARVKAYADAHGISVQVAADQLINPILDSFLGEML